MRRSGVRIPLPPPLEAYEPLGRTNARSTGSASADLKLDRLFVGISSRKSYRVSETTGVLCLNHLIDRLQKTH